MIEDALPNGHSSSSDAVAIRQVCAGDLGAFEALMRRYNRRVFRTARGILRDDAEAEDAVQDTWIAVYRHLAKLESPEAFSSWLTRIAVRSALARVNRERPLESLDVIEETDCASEAVGVEEAMEKKQVSMLVEQAMDSLPASYRVALMLRDIEQMSGAEAADALGISEENLRIRLHRARAALRARIGGEVERTQMEAFTFDGARCDRMVARVLGAIQRS